MPKDPVMLLSYVNLKLRDYYSSFHEFCIQENADAAAITESLKKIGYTYNNALNQFV